jgi:HEAT repeat protein
MRRLLGPALVALGLLPAVTTALTTLAQDRPPTAQERILAAIPEDASVLINVPYHDMPSTPDILELGKRSTKALERCLADNVDENVRMLCAVVLQALGDRRALGTLQAALDDWDAGVRHRVVLALSSVPDPSSVDPLIKLFRRTDEDGRVRFAVLEALATISDPRVVRFLRDELRSKREEKDTEEYDFRASVFDALWHHRHLTAPETLVGDTRAALESDNQSLQLAATLAAADLRSPRLVPSLVDLMEHPNVEVRNKAVYALGRIGDRTATKALLEHLPNVRESRMLNNIAFALERLDKKAFHATIAQIIGHKQAVIRLNAAFVLGDVRHPEGLPLLETALGDASDFVRTSAIVAVAKIGQNDAAERKRALDDLSKFVGDGNINVKLEAILGVHRLTEGGRNDLVHDELFELDPTWYGEAVQRAGLELAKAGDARVREWVTTCVIHRGCSLEAIDAWVKTKDPEVSGRLLLAWARGDARLTDTVAALDPPGTLPTAKSALLDATSYPDMFRLTGSAVLGGLGDPSVLPLVQEHARAKHASERIHALVAASRLGDDDAQKRLLAELDGLPAEWLPGYVRAVGRIAEPEVRAKLLPALMQKQQDADPHVALAAAAVHLRWDPDAAVFRFLDALASPSSYERTLAERYLVRADERRVTWLLRRMLAREGREGVRDRLRALLDRRR